MSEELVPNQEAMNTTASAEREGIPNRNSDRERITMDSKERKQELVNDRKHLLREINWRLGILMWGERELEQLLSKSENRRPCLVVAAIQDEQVVIERRQIPRELDTPSTREGARGEPEHPG